MNPFDVRMPSSPEPTDQVLSDVTQRLEALNRSQISLFSVHSSVSLPVRYDRRLRELYTCDTCMQSHSSSEQLQSHRQIHTMEVLTFRPPVCKGTYSGRDDGWDTCNIRVHNGSDTVSNGRSSKTRLKTFLKDSRKKLKRSKPEPVPKFQVSAYFAGRKTSQRSASSGDSGYESMERPDPVESLLGWKSRESEEREQPIDVIYENVKSGTDTHDASTLAFFDRRKKDQINKFKRFSKELDKQPLLKQSIVTGTEKLSGKQGVEADITKPSKTGPERPRLVILKPDVAKDGNEIGMLSSAMSSTDDVLGELISSTAYRSRLESCRQSGGSLSDGELSFMGGRGSKAASLYSINIFDVEGDNVAQSLAHNILNRCFNQQSHRYIRSRTTSGQGSNQSSPPTSARHTPATSVSSVFKRSRGKDEGSQDPDEDDGRGNDTSAKRIRTEVQADVKLFACPYAKYDPRRYSELNLIEKEYRRCTCSYLRDIPRLKQHLYRVHRRPEYYCGSCFESFKSREILDVHTRQRPSCDVRSPRFEEKMTDEQLNSIKRRIVKGDPPELWFNIFKTLFPEAPRPLSPYASDNDPTTVNHFVNLFRWFGPEEMGNLIRARREQGDRRSILEGTTQAVVDEAFEIALPQYLQAQQDVRSSSSTSSDLSRVPSTPNGFVDVGVGSGHAHSGRHVTGTHVSYVHPVPDYHEDYHGQATFMAQMDNFSMPSFDQSQMYQTSGWLDTNMDLTDVMQAFEAYGAVSKRPLQNISELDADTFFDFPV